MQQIFHYLANCISITTTIASYVVHEYNYSNIHQAFHVIAWPHEFQAMHIPYITKS